MKALECVNILDFTHMRSGPARAQPPARLGADVFEVECPGAEYVPGTKAQTMYK